MDVIRSDELTAHIQSHLDDLPEGKIPLIVILGPTAAGKTALSIGLAQKFNGEVISADSRQVYKGMDVGTDKITEEETCGVPHHMLDVVEPDEDFSVFNFKMGCNELIPQIWNRGNVPFIVGGTMLYIDAVVENFDFDGVEPDEDLRNELTRIRDEEGKDALYEKLKEVDPQAAERIHPNNSHYVMRAIEKAMRPPKKEETKMHNYHVLKVGIIRPREELFERINGRVEEQCDGGKLKAEATWALETYDHSCRSITGLGYRQWIGHVCPDEEGRQERSLDEVKLILKRQTRNFARRQLTWWRKHNDILWVNVSEAPNEKITF